MADARGPKHEPVRVLVTPPALTAPIRVQMLSALGAGDAASTPITTGTTPLINLGATAPVNGANSNAAASRSRRPAMPPGSSPPQVAHPFR